MRRSPLSLAALALAAACEPAARPAAPTAPGGAPVASRENAPAGPIFLPFSGSDTNPCTGEGFSYAGTLRLLRQQRSNGIWELVVAQTSASAVGIGDAGTRYVIRYNEIENNHFVFESPAGQATVVGTYRVTSTGGGVSFRMHAVLRVILNPDFTASVIVDRTTESCAG